MSMAHRRAAEKDLPFEERAARRKARLEAGLKYREKNREVLALVEKERRRVKKKMPGYAERYEFFYFIDIYCNIYYHAVSSDRKRCGIQKKRDQQMCRAWWTCQARQISTIQHPRCRWGRKRHAL